MDVAQITRNCQKQVAGSTCSSQGTEIQTVVPDSGVISGSLLYIELCSGWPGEEVGGEVGKKAHCRKVGKDAYHGGRRHVAEMITRRMMITDMRRI